VCTADLSGAPPSCACADAIGLIRVMHKVSQQVARQLLICTWQDSVTCPAAPNASASNVIIYGAAGTGDQHAATLPGRLVFGLAALRALLICCRAVLICCRAGLCWHGEATLHSNMCMQSLMCTPAVHHLCGTACCCRPCRLPWAHSRWERLFVMVVK
jgi:hypothetical protein